MLGREGRCLFGVEQAGWLLSTATVEIDTPSDPNDVWYISTAVAEIERDRMAAERGNYGMRVSVRSGMKTCGLQGPCKESFGSCASGRELSQRRIKQWRREESGAVCGLNAPLVTALLMAVVHVTPPVCNESWEFMQETFAGCSPLAYSAAPSRQTTNHTHLPTEQSKLFVAHSVYRCAICSHFCCMLRQFCYFGSATTANCHLLGSAFMYRGGGYYLPPDRCAPASAERT